MTSPTKGRLMLVDDGSSDASAIRHRLATRHPGSSVLTASRREADYDLEPIRVTADQVSLRRGILEAADRGIVWVVVPRTLTSPRDLMRDAVKGTAEVVSNEAPGYVVLAASDVDREASYKRVAVILDNEDQGTSGMVWLATVGLAISEGAEIDVLVLGVDRNAGSTWEELADEIKVQRAKDLMRAGALRARDAGIRPNWFPIGDPPDKVDAVQDFVLLNQYDVIVVGVGDLRLGMKGRRAKNLEKVIDSKEGGGLALSVLEAATCDVALVVDGVSTGVITPGMIRGGAVAGLAMGSVFTGGLTTAKTAQAAEVGSSAVAATATADPTATATTATTGSNLSLITEAGVVSEAGLDEEDLLVQVEDDLKQEQKEQKQAERAAQEAAEKEAEREAASGPLTGAELEQIAPTTPDELADEYAMRINLAMDHYNIDTPQQQAMFVAQLAHETDGFQTLEEYASGADYEGRSDLGNTQPGDGERYKGRGAIQLTGRANYEAASAEFGVDFVANPELAASPEYAFEIAGWFWESHGLNEVSASGDFVQVTQTINGGMNGYDDRVNYLESADAVF